MPYEKNCYGNFRLPEAEYLAAKELAAKKDWSLSKLVRRMLQNAVAADKQQEHTAA